MNALMRMVIISFVVGLLTLCVFGLRFACSPRDAQERRRGEDLRKLERVTLRHQESRRQAVDEWIAQHCTLAETMQRFQELDQEWPAYITKLRNTMSESDEQRHYWVIFAYVEAALQERPEELAAARSRLEKDYRQLQDGRQTPSSAATERIERSR